MQLSEKQKTFSDFFFFGFFKIYIKFETFAKKR